MARRERQGFMIYHDVAVNTLQYLPADVFKAVIMAAVDYSIAQAEKREGPDVDFSGIALGAYRQLCSGADYSAFQWVKKACYNRMAKRQEKQAELAKLSIQLLQERGYTECDIAIIKDMPLEDVIRIGSVQRLPTVTDGYQQSPTVTNKTELESNRNRTDIQTDIYKDKDRESEREREREGAVNDRQRPSTTEQNRQSMILKLSEIGVDLGTANQLLKEYESDLLLRKIDLYKNTDHKESFRAYLLRQRSGIDNAS